MITQEFVTAEINYRFERAQAAALVREARAARRPSRLRRWLTRSSHPPVRRTPSRQVVTG